MFTKPPVPEVINAKTTLDMSTTIDTVTAPLIHIARKRVLIEAPLGVFSPDRPFGCDFTVDVPATSAAGVSKNTKSR